MHCGDMGGDQLIAISSHRDISRGHDDRIERGGIPVRPQLRCSVSQIARPGGDHPHQHGKASRAHTAQNEETIAGNQRASTKSLGARKRIGSEQFQKRIIALVRALREGRQPLLQAGVCSLGLVGSPVARHANRRQRNAKHRHQSERNKNR
jgi:hypothetical protein